MFLTRTDIISQIRKGSELLFSEIEDTGVYVDIGCEEPDSTPSLSDKTITQSKLALLFEPRTDYFNQTHAHYCNLSNVIVKQDLVTPHNVVNILRDSLGNDADNIFILDLDIDGYDFYVAEAILRNNIKPIFLSVEINEKIPPPLKFSVLYNENLLGNDAHFFGASISKMYELIQYEYDMIQLLFNSLFFIRKDKNPYYRDNNKYKMFRPRTDIEVYDNQYIQPRLHEKIQYNLDVKFWQDIKNHNQLIETINDHFSHHKNEYELYI
jgi:hypothetical protein